MSTTKREYTWSERHYQKLEEEKQRILDTYRKIYRGEIDQEEAAKSLGYTCFKNLDRRRRNIGLPKMYDIVHGVEINNRDIPEDVIRYAMKKIAEEQCKGNRVREEVAREIGFVDFHQMDQRRTKLGIPSVRSYIYILHPEIYEKYRKEIVKPAYIRSLQKKKKRGELKW